MDKKFNKKIEKPILKDRSNLKNLQFGHLAAVLNNVHDCKKYYDIAISNNNPKWIYDYALDLISLGEYFDALIQLKKLLKNQDVIPLERIYFNIAKCYHERICLYKSIKYYKKAILINNNDFKAHTNLGNVYKDFGFFEEALKHYNYVLNQDDTFQEALINIIDLYDKMGDKKNFDKYNTKLKYIHKTPLTNYYGGLISKDRDILKFLSSMDNALEDYQFQISALVQQFEFHLEKNNIESANLKFDEIFELLKDDVDLGIHLCFLYNDFGYYEEAITRFDNIYNRYDEKDSKLLLKKAILLENYDLNEATEFCKSLLNENYDDSFKSEIYNILGNFYLEIDNEKSWDYYLKAFDLNSKNTTLLKNLAVYHAVKQEFFLAEEYIDMAFKLDNHDYDYCYIKSKLCFDQYKHEEAIIYFNKCLKMKPSCEIYLNLAASFGCLENSAISLFYLNLAINLSDETNYIEIYSLYLYLLDLQI